VAAVDVAFADFDAEFANLVSAKGPDAHRRSLRSVLACLYEVRAFREGNTKSENTAYHGRAASSIDGQITEGISWLRGLMTHSLTPNVAPDSPLHPSDRLFPSPYLYPGTNPCWRPLCELTAAHVQRASALNPQGAALYVSHVGNQPVLPTLHVAREFLGRDPGPTS
jgi:hypothetical protein